MSKIFDDPNTSLNEPSLQVSVGFKDLAAVLGQQTFRDALAAAAGGDTSLAADYLKALPNYANNASVTVNLKTADNKVVLLSLGLAQFDYVAGEHKLYECALAVSAICALCEVSVA